MHDRKFASQGASSLTVASLSTSSISSRQPHHFFEDSPREQRLSPNPNFGALEEGHQFFGSSISALLHRLSIRRFLAPCCSRQSLPFFKATIRYCPSRLSRSPSIHLDGFASHLRMLLCSPSTTSFWSFFTRRGHHPPSFTSYHRLTASITPTAFIVLRPYQIVPTSMAPSFNSIPREIHRKIYEYLLFDLNLVTVRECEEDWLELRPVCAASLFTVNGASRKKACNISHTKLIHNNRVRCSSLSLSLPAQCPVDFV